MSSPADLIRRRVHDDYDGVAAGWTRWEPYFAGDFWPVTHALISELRLTPASRVLDFGCGIGDPSLMIAAAIAPTGRVLAIDLAERMIETARQRAAALGLDNVEYRIGAVEDLAEPPGSFDAAVGRFSVMFLPDVDAGLRRLHGLLRDGGRIALATWTPPEANPMFDLPATEIRKVVDVPPPSPDAPGPLRLAADGELADALARAGFRDVTTRTVRAYAFARDADDYWAFVTETSSAVRRQLAAISEADRRRIQAGIAEAVERYRVGPVIRIPALARVGSATK